MKKLFMRKRMEILFYSKTNSNLDVNNLVKFNVFPPSIVSKNYLVFNGLLIVSLPLSVYKS